MIQEMSLNLFGERFAAGLPKPGAEDIRLAKALVDDAGQRVSQASEQQKYAQMAQTLIAHAENDAHRTELARIAVWHFENCAAGFRHSVVSFESAAKIQKDEKLRRRLLKKAESAAESAMRAELSVLELKSAEKKRKGGFNIEKG